MSPIPQVWEYPKQGSVPFLLRPIVSVEKCGYRTFLTQIQLFLKQITMFWAGLNQAEKYSYRGRGRKYAVHLLNITFSYLFKNLLFEEKFCSIYSNMSE